ncbi:hypothetical protein [Moorena sp. SIO1G6]|nr:hypothetical protein [Moorena sp. SIO1G6]
MVYIIEFGQALVNQTLTDFFLLVSSQRSAVSAQPWLKATLREWLITDS